MCWWNAVACNRVKGMWLPELCCPSDGVVLWLQGWLHRHECISGRPRKASLAARDTRTSPSFLSAADWQACDACGCFTGRHAGHRLRHCMSRGGCHSAEIFGRPGHMRGPLTCITTRQVQLSVCSSSEIRVYIRNLLQRCSCWASRACCSLDGVMHSNGQCCCAFYMSPPQMIPTNMNCSTQQQQDAYHR